ncbi:hypothetical protein [Streptomyces uncialis]|uniref:Uncharacterized protein n=1 Tax=Streptomyces uncialis TaxID=1048205 RepID=A0A1Q4V6Y3_9ACTN|nr:hypothetical protein [Streptomyces uncialis]OKH93585.1 hypothetical protein AB852_19245 [Streptomyces uncialis]WTE13951.1 hypothetical protein OG924_29215 [Streptomyces uncialis]
MTGVDDGDDATARAFIAHHLHGVAANAAEDGHPALVEAAAAERTAREEHGRLEGNTPQFVYGWAQQDAIKAGQDAMFGRGLREAWEQAKQQMEVVGRWLAAHGHQTEGVTK